jgi:hypothetical protein
MIQDPSTMWDGPFPYDELAPAGITPQSSHDQVVNDAPFTLMTSGLLTARSQRALDELRDLERRLVVDFLLYDVDLPAEIARARQRPRPAQDEPAAVADELSATPRWLMTLAAQLAAAAPDPASGVPERPGPHAFPVLALIDQLIEFDH